MIKVYFPPASSSAVEPSGEPATQFALPVVPDVVLQRHGARVLRADDAARVIDAPPPKPTVYRYGILLIPENRLRQGVIDVLNAAIADLRMQLVPPPPLEELIPGARDSKAFATLPRPVEIQPRDSFLAGAVDGWTVLQRLRAVAKDTRPPDAKNTRAGLPDTEQATADNLWQWIGELSLDHLLVGSAVDGAGSAVIVGANTASHGSPDVADLFNRPQFGTSGRVPVNVVLGTPDRPPMGAKARRRAVVAVLDTGVARHPAHPWLSPMVERGRPRYKDAVVLWDQDIQDTIKKAAQLASGAPRVPIEGVDDDPYIEEPLVGELSTHAGHGTFIAGIIRQLAPSAQVLAIRVMHPDGFAHEADLTVALTYLVDEVHKAQRGKAALPVDIVSLSLGYFHESDAERAVTSRLEPLLKELTDAGVIVVAAAGNFSTSRPFYPAALSPDLAAANPKAAPLISVGALNPNDTTAMFSNEAPWVNCYASGVALISTFPIAFRGSWQPPAKTGRRESFDVDNFTSGYASWSGTSFATPVVAGLLAADLGSDAGSYDDKPVQRANRARKSWESLQKSSLYAI